MKITPLGERVVITLQKQENKTQSGILLAGTNERQRDGKVIKSNIDEIKEGDIIMIKGYSHLDTEFEIDGEKIYIVDFKNIIGKKID